jgi:hypothetical protein
VWEQHPNNVGAVRIPAYISPRDPSSPLFVWTEVHGPAPWAPCNYEANHAVFGIPCGSNVVSKLTLVTITDGTSNTVGFAEQYAKCQQGADPGASGDNHWHHLWAYYTPWNWDQGPYFDTRIMSTGMLGNNQGNNSACTCIATSTAVVPQNQPTVDACNPSLVQAMDGSGCIVGLMDGSVRTVSTSVSPTTWVRAIWPNDTFVVGDW